MSYGRPTRLGELAADEPEAQAVVLTRIDDRTRELVERAKADDKRRKMTFILTAIGVAFAAVKLGFVAVPHFLKRRAKPLGDLGGGK